MKIRSTNPLVRYFNFIFEYYPIDFCTLFWGSLYAIIFFWLEIPGKWLSKKIGYRRIFWHGWFCYLILIMTVQIIRFIIWLFGIDWLNIDWIWLLKLVGGTILVLIVVAIIVVAIVSLCLFVSDTIKEKVLHGQPSRFAIWWATIRGKYCTKIEYV